MDIDIKYALGEILSTGNANCLAPFCFMIVRENAGSSSSEIAGGTGSTKPTVEKRLKSLVEIGLVEKRGNNYYINITEQEEEAVSLDELISSQQSAIKERPPSNERAKEKSKPKYQFANDMFKVIKDIYGKHGLVYIQDKKDRQALFWMHKRKTYEYTEPMKERLLALGVETFEERLDMVLYMRGKLTYTNARHSVNTLGDVYRNFSNIYNKFNQDGHTFDDVSIEKDDTAKAREIVAEGMGRANADSTFWDSFAQKHGPYYTTYAAIYYDIKTRRDMSQMSGLKLPPNIDDFDDEYINGLSPKHKNIANTFLQKYS